MSDEDNLPIPEKDGSQPLENKRWEAFCVAYTGEFRGNGAASYRAAGYKTKKTVSDQVNASRLLTYAIVKQRVNYLNGKVLERMEEAKRLSLERLAAIATISYADFLGENGKVDIGKVKDPKLSPAVKRCTAIRDKDGRIIDYYLELYDALKAPELLGFAQQQEQSAQVNQVLVIKV